MKLIAVDAGNTSTAIGLWSGGKVHNVVHCDGPFDEAAARFDALYKSAAAKGALGVAYASVVPRLDAKWRAHAKRRGIRLVAVDHTLVKTPRIDYGEPATIGTDRLADAAGAVARYGAPVLIMDFGTALTAAVVTDDCVWRGGVIAPGFPLMRDYLFERTAKLPRMELPRGKEPKIGRSTLEAMKFGAMVGYRGMVREIVETLRRNFRCDFRLVATGGFAREATKGLGMDFTVDPTLTLYGTGLLCSQNF